MPKSNTCSIFECGRIKIFQNTSLLADYLKVDPETCRRWRRDLVKADRPLIWSFEGMLIDFEPTIYGKTPKADQVTTDPSCYTIKLPKVNLEDIGFKG